MFRWGEPQWLNFVWLCVFLFFGTWLWNSHIHKKMRRRLGEKTWPFLIASLSVAKRRWHLILQCLTLAFFAVALARPLLGIGQTEVKQTGIELIIAVDVSNSMLAEDSKPSRLDHAKHALGLLLDRLSGSRVGLVAFAGSAVLVSPMTTDYNALKMYLNSLTPDSVSTQGTNFKAVIDEATRAFDRGGVESLQGDKPTRALIFASDGEETEGDVGKEAKKALDQGVRIFGLGFGTKQGAPIPVRDDRGTLRGYKKDKSDQVVMSMPNDEVLAGIARDGGGSYYHASVDEGEVRSLVEDLNHLQKVDFKSRLATDYDEKFQIPLLLGLLLAFMDLVFGDRKSGSQNWRGRFEVRR